MKATSRSLRIAPKKLNLIAELVRNKKTSDAMNILSFTPKKGAKLLYKVIHSAVANAENNFKQDPQSLYIKEIVVTKAATIKRSVPISRGRVNPILKRNTHVTVTIGVEADAKPSKSGKKAEAAVKAAPGKETKTVKAPAKKKAAVSKSKATKA
jgi:large subunit ribosomal protein L22